jgi:hypothetical protein
MDISNNYLNKGENDREAFIVSDGFTSNFTAVYNINKENLGNITWTYFLEKIKTNDIYKTSIETEIKSITNQFITDILNYKDDQSTKTYISKYITDPSANDTTQQFVDYIFISLLWNGGYDASCSYNTPEYVNIPQIVDTSGQYVESTPLSVKNKNFGTYGKWGDLLEDQPQLQQEPEQEQEPEPEPQTSINEYIIYLKKKYCPLPNKRTPQETNLISIKRIKDKYGDVGIFYILSLIVNTISNVDSLYIPPISKDSNMENKIILGPLGGGDRGGIANITSVSFFQGISGVYNTVASEIPTTNGGSNKSKTYKKRDKRRQNRKTMKSKNRVF